MFWDGKSVFFVPAEDYSILVTTLFNRKEDMKKSTCFHVFLGLALLFFLFIPATSDAQTGSLQVSIEPEEAVRDGAQWRRVDTEPWLDSGFTESGILEGTYEVEFRDIRDWTRPNNRSVTVAEEQTTRISVTYFRRTGGLRVFINPPAVRDAGAQWRRFGTDIWFNSGDTEIDIPTGDHLVEFKDVAGWAKPPIQVVTILGDRIIDKEVSYSQGGDLQVILEPSAARAAGAGWKLAGVIPDNDEGWHTADITTIAGIRPGVHTIEFRAIPGWMKPEDQTVTIRAGRTTFITGRYVMSTEEGFLRVFIEPSSAANLGARWRRVGTDIWLHSGETERGFPEGTFTIEFKPIPGWATPGNKAVSIHRGQPPASLVGVYTSPQTRVRVMNWLETVYPHLLPVSGMEVIVRDDWYIRYYPETDTYLGSEGVRLYYYAPSVKDKVRDLGDLEDWLPMAREAGF